MVIDEDRCTNFRFFIRLIIRAFTCENHCELLWDPFLEIFMNLQVLNIQSMQSNICPPNPNELATDVEIMMNLRIWKAALRILGSMTSTKEKNGRQSHLLTSNHGAAWSQRADRTMQQGDATT